MRKMQGRTKRFANLTAPLYEHWSEHDERVRAYLTETFGVAPIKQPEGADLLCGGVRVEVKFCRKWCKANPKYHRGATRRRGRFMFHGYEDADYFLFVLENGGLQMDLMKTETFHKLHGSGVKSVVWTKIFPQDAGVALERA
jgi:hypothetical protein